MNGTVSTDESSTDEFSSDKDSFAEDVFAEESAEEFSETEVCVQAESKATHSRTMAIFFIGKTSIFVVLYI